MWKTSGNTENLYKEAGTLLYLLGSCRSLQPQKCTPNYPCKVNAEIKSSIPSCISIDHARPASTLSRYITKRGIMIDPKILMKIESDLLFQTVEIPEPMQADVYILASALQKAIDEK